MRFAIYGAYKLPRVKGPVIDNSAKSKSDFWAAIEDQAPGLPDACGCYVFAAHNNPWYVGHASKQSFRNECMTSHKASIYSMALAEYKQAAPWLYLIAKLTPGGSFAAPSVNGRKDVAALEKILIGLALAKNPEVSNIQGTKFLRRMNVPGLINSEKGQASSRSVQGIRSLFGF